MSHPVRQDAGPTRTRSVVFAVALQLLLAATFVISAIEVLTSGVAAEAAAKAELARQGFPADVLVDQGIRFGDKGLDSTALPIAIAVILVTLALLNLAGNRAGRLLSWIVHPILILAGSLIIPGQVFTAPLLESTLKNSGDATLQRIDVPAVVDAAAHAYPAWLPYVAGAKLVLATLGSLSVVILLALRPFDAEADAGDADFAGRGTTPGGSRFQKPFGPG